MLRKTGGKRRFFSELRDREEPNGEHCKHSRQTARIFSQGRQNSAEIGVAQLSTINPDATFAAYGAKERHTQQNEGCYHEGVARRMSRQLV
jgi:hypothetical protein